MSPPLKFFLAESQDSPVWHILTSTGDMTHWYWRCDSLVLKMWLNGTSYLLEALHTLPGNVHSLHTVPLGSRVLERSMFSVHPFFRLVNALLSQALHLVVLCCETKGAVSWIIELFSPRTPYAWHIILFFSMLILWSYYTISWQFRSRLSLSDYSKYVKSLLDLPYSSQRLPWSDRLLGDMNSHAVDVIRLVLRFHSAIDQKCLWHGL